MRILVLSWEFPPRIIGGLGRHVAALTRDLVAQGHEVHVVTREHPDAPAHEWVADIDVTRVTTEPDAIDFSDLIPWVLAFNASVLSAATGLARRIEFDVVHAHDWLVAHAGVGISRAFDLPLVATIHATEYGRHQGHLPGPMNRLIHDIERWLTAEAQRTIVCSAYMREQVSEIFALPEDSIDVIPNGVDVDDFMLPDAEVSAFRRELAPDGERLVLFAGRLEYEKGVQTVLRSLDRLTATIGPVRFLIAGVGTYSEELRHLVDELGLGPQVTFTGFLDDHALKLHYAAADVAVAPSLYEPFGLVATEAMACGTPVVASDTGGLREIVTGGHGLTFPPQDEVGLADRIAEVLTDPAMAADLVTRARRRIRSLYAWADVARATADVYAQVAASADTRSGATADASERWIETITEHGATPSTASGQAG